MRCPEGHEWSTLPNNFKRGNRCPKCSGMCSIQAEEQFKELVENEGYELLDEYKNNKTKVKLRCNKGHEYYVTPIDFKHNYRCLKCVGLCPIQAKEQFIHLLNKEGYELLDEYKNNKTKVKLKCNKGHDYYVMPYSFKNNYSRCPHCEGSTGQRKLQEMLKLYIKDDVIYNDRKLLEGLELDIYYPSLNIAIEYQGNYWHNRPETMERDRRKEQLCEEKGIILIEVWDDDFLKNPEEITKKIYNDIILKVGD